MSLAMALSQDYQQLPLLKSLKLYVRFSCCCLWKKYVSNGRRRVAQDQFDGPLQKKPR